MCVEVSNVQFHTTQRMLDKRYINQRIARKNKYTQEHTVSQFHNKMGLFRAKSKKSIGKFLFWNISFPQKLHPQTFSVKPEQ